jgi:hypothetical protein
LTEFRKSKQLTLTLNLNLTLETALGLGLGLGETHTFWLPPYLRGHWSWRRRHTWVRVRVRIRIMVRVRGRVKLTGVPCIIPANPIIGLAGAPFWMIFTLFIPFRPMLPRGGGRWRELQLRCNWVGGVEKDVKMR